MEEDDLPLMRCRHLCGVERFFKYFFKHINQSRLLKNKLSKLKTDILIKTSIINIV